MSFVRTSPEPRDRRSSQVGPAAWQPTPPPLVEPMLDPSALETLPARIPFRAGLFPERWNIVAPTVFGCITPLVMLQLARRRKVAGFFIARRNKSRSSRFARESAASQAPRPNDRRITGPSRLFRGGLLRLCVQRPVPSKSNDQEDGQYQFEIWGWGSPGEMLMAIISTGAPKPSIALRSATVTAARWSSIVIGVVDP